MLSALSASLAHSTIQMNQCSSSLRSEHRNTKMLLVGYGDSVDIRSTSKVSYDASQNRHYFGFKHWCQNDYHQSPAAFSEL